MTWTNAEPDTLMERVLAPANLRRAYQRVVSNKGAPGADGMTVSGSFLRFSSLKLPFTSS
ncbi:group II intron-encoding maturase [Pseudomonas putida DOT-T1E]|uniref:Group II intron-encoding maturase n=1 Tax=Pseudomonas putida (strain DOT-T1E) TaxID=1196325 RepID=I7BZA5_PSEPT|nr:group II intron-encoding maturase [Pseudomonas putida DOT-T1E]